MAQETLQDPAQAMKLDQLRKVLSLEQSKGYSNSAVVGGLDGFLSRWAGEAHRAVPHPMVRSGLRRLGLSAPNYGAMAPHERADWVEKVLRWSTGLDGLPASSAVTEESSSPGEKAPHPSRPKPVSPFLGPGQDLDTPLARVKGFTADLASKLERLGVVAVRDLLYYFPRRHIDFTSTQPIGSLEVGKDHTAIGTVWEAKELRFGGRNRRAAEAVISDDTGSVRAIWFNQPYMASTLKRGGRVALSGRVSMFKGHKVFENPEYEFVGSRELVHTARLVPVYPLTAGLTSRRMRTVASRAVDGAAHLLGDFLPPAQRRRLGLADLSWAIREAHFPTADEGKDRARRRLAFDELFLIQLGVLGRKRAWQEGMPGASPPLRPAGPRSLHQVAALHLDRGPGASPG